METINSTQHPEEALGSQITFVQAEDGTVYVPLKRLCEALGIDYQRQRSKVRNSKELRAELVSVPGTDGRHRKMLCLPLEDVGAWASTIDPNTLRPEIVEALTDLLEEPDEVSEGDEKQGAATDPRVHKLSAQMLNLRSALVPLAKAIHDFPSFGSELECSCKYPQARLIVNLIYDDMHTLLASTRTALSAVLLPAPEVWDFLWFMAKYRPVKEHAIADSVFWRLLRSDQNDFINVFAQTRNRARGKFQIPLREDELKSLAAEGAWQTGSRLPQILHLLNYLENQIAKQLELLDSAFCGGVLGDCDLGRWADKDKAALN